MTSTANYARSKRSASVSHSTISEPAIHPSAIWRDFLSKTGPVHAFADEKTFTAAAAFGAALKAAAKASGQRRGLAPAPLIELYVLSLLAQHEAAAWTTAATGGHQSTAPTETLSGAVVLDFTVELGNIAATGVCDLFIVEKLVAV